METAEVDYVLRYFHVLRAHHWPDAPNSPTTKKKRAADVLQWLRRGLIADSIVEVLERRMHNAASNSREPPVLISSYRHDLEHKLAQLEADPSDLPPQVRDQIKGERKRQNRSLLFLNFIELPL